MNHHINARALHELLDDIAKGYQPHAAEIDNLRACLPEQPKQKTLVEIRDSVDAAWRWAANGNTWTNNEKTLDMWLQEQKEQLDGLIDNGYTTPALPDGMRLAYHEEYGQVVVSPGLNDFGLYLIFVLDSDYKEGAHWHCEHGRTLTFIDAEPAKPVHPEFLETEADYENAPDGTVVACDDSPPWHKFEFGWLSTITNGYQSAKATSGVRRYVLRWGWSK